MIIKESTKKEMQIKDTEVKKKKRSIGKKTDGSLDTLIMTVLFEQGFDILYYTITSAEVRNNNYWSHRHFLN